MGLKAHRARASSEPGLDKTSLDAGEARVSAGLSEVVMLVPRSACPHASEAGVLDSSPWGGTCPNAGDAKVRAAAAAAAAATCPNAGDARVKGRVDRQEQRLLQRALTPAMPRSGLLLLLLLQRALTPAMPGSRDVWITRSRG